MSCKVAFEEKTYVKLSLKIREFLLNLKLDFNVSISSHSQMFYKIGALVGTSF